MEQLLSELEDIAISLQKAQTNLKKCPKQRLTRGYVESRLQNIEEYWKSFTAAHSKLIKVVPKEKKNDISYFVNDDYFLVEDLYLILKGDLRDLLISMSSMPSDYTKGDKDHGTSFEGQIKLPTIELPTFSGVYEEWPSFQDLFIALVHNNSSLSAVQKLHYLKNSLQGEAECLLKHIPITVNNYEQAWELLKERYNNKRIIVNSLLNKLLTQRKIPTQTANNIKTLLDTTCECLNSLKNLNVSTDSWDPLIIFLVVQKLDPESHREWEVHAYQDNLDELPTWNNLVKFLQTKYRTLELIAPSAREKSYKKREYTVHHVSTSTPTANKLKGCTICHENHRLYHCGEFIKMDPMKRCQHVVSNNLCFNCLAPGHLARVCRLNTSCRVCHKRHHSLVHQPMPGISTNSTIQPDNIQAHHLHVENQEQVDKECKTHVELSSHFTTDASTALLATALVPVRDEFNHVTILRALVDQGSQATFISERAAQLLRLKRQPVHGTISGVGSTETAVNHAAHIEILSKHDDSFKLKVKAYIMSTRLTAQLPSQTISINTWPHLEGLFLADPTFNKRGRIDMLLGVDVCAQILKGEVIQGPAGTPCAQNTSLGWILFGNIQDDLRKKRFNVMHLKLNLDNMLKSMWELDNEEVTALTVEEKKCEEIYQATHSRTNEGQYIVKLPTKTNELQCTQGGTREIALRRFHQLEKRLNKDRKLKEQYVAAMEEYLTMNHMEEVPAEDVKNEGVYMPHHPVIREEKETTKVRPVFNASQKGTNGISLNDELLVGPQLQTDMRSLIIRWRSRRICFVADIQKMYRCILVTKEDRDLQRILWRSNVTKPIQDFRLLRVTFGTASAPYLAVRTLQQLADDEGHVCPEAAKTIKEDFYVDDLMSGKDSLSGAMELAKNIDAILQKGGFILQKWCSNSAEFLKHFDITRRSAHVDVDISIHGTITALGLRWNMGQDIFQYSLNLPAMAVPVTKRTILADVQRLFDPLGWLSPGTLPAKLLIQKLWLKGISWDEELDTTTIDDWITLRDNLRHINEIEVPRWLCTTEDKRETIEVHGFCDASVKAYAAVAYARVVKEDEVTTVIIAGKTRVAPVKPVSLPRLELCGALLLSRLLKQIKQALKLTDAQIFAWTDSTIVLAWLQGDPARWHTFVRNRVVEIVDNTGKNWYHVQTDENPADSASRGERILELKENQKWWKGPEWLRYKKILLTKPENVNTNLEEKIKLHTNIKIEQQTSIGTQFKNFNTLSELLITITYCTRFLKGKKMIYKDSPMTTKELDTSLKTCIKIIQREIFKDEIKNLNENSQIKGESRLKALQPYLDDESILRVGGRLRNADLDQDCKHPIILDDTNHLSVLIVDDAHRRTLHGGVQLMLGYLRSKFWIIKAKKLVKFIKHKCLLCARHNAATKNQLMGDLPHVRVTPARPFLNSGVDFAGPYDILPAKGRGIRTVKAYVAIFICMATKAIHLELVGDLTAEAFVGAFKRFVARRGKCANLWSDQGRNFVGANKELVAAWSEAKLRFEGPVLQSLALDGTQWHFIPAYSPHMGGLWEAGVKSMKHHMKRILSSHLTYEEMTTLLSQIEACLNSRPLCPLEDTDSNEVPLTPGHFLIGEAPICIPQPDLQDVPINHLTRWQHTQKLLNNFWSRWQSEYLTRLQQRPKWLKKVAEFEIGQIVIIKSENLPPGKWSLGRIVDKHPGEDGITRVYSVKSGASITKRSFNKLCLLPIDIDT